MSDSKPAGSFIELLKAALRRVDEGGRDLRFPAGHVLFREGDFGDGVYLIEEGSVEISTLMPGRDRRVLSRLGPGSFFGEMAVVDEQPRSATVTSESEIRVTFLPSAVVWELLGRSPELLVSLMREIIRRLRTSERRYLEEVIQAERLALVGRFAQSIVHDLKNPLSTISVAASLAGDHEAPQESRHAAGEEIVKQVGRLAGMINEVIEFTRGTGQSVKLAPVSFRGFVESVLAEFRPGLLEKSVAIECEDQSPDVTVLIDLARLPHVFSNLLGNAVDAMPSGGKVTLRFFVEASEVITEVEDTGPGIPAEIVPRLFEPFATHGKRHGTGLGLSICKRIVENHGGRLWFRNGSGVGATFSFSLQRQN